MSEPASQVLIWATTSSSAAAMAAWACWRVTPGGRARRADQVVPMVAPASATGSPDRRGGAEGMRAASGGA